MLPNISCSNYQPSEPLGFSVSRGECGQRFIKPQNSSQCCYISTMILEKATFSALPWYMQDKHTARKRQATEKIHPLWNWDVKHKTEIMWTEHASPSMVGSSLPGPRIPVDYQLSKKHKWKTFWSSALVFIFNSWKLGRYQVSAHLWNNESINTRLSRKFYEIGLGEQQFCWKWQQHWSLKNFVIILSGLNQRNLFCVLWLKIVIYWSE